LTRLAAAFNPFGMGDEFEKWKDSRMHKPKCSGCDYYPVIFKLTDSIATRGYAKWMPIYNYTDGVWAQCFTQNMNPQSNCEVLYWMSLPDKPKDIEL
jgi:hypothetical protein